MLPRLSLLGLKMITLGLLLKFKHCKELLMDSSHKKVISQDQLKMQMLEIETCLLNFWIERPSKEQLMINSLFLEKSKMTLFSTIKI